MNQTKLLQGAREEIARLEEKAAELEAVQEEIKRLQQVIDLLEPKSEISIASPATPSDRFHLPVRTKRVVSAATREKQSKARKAAWDKKFALEGIKEVS